MQLGWLIDISSITSNNTVLTADYASTFALIHHLQHITLPNQMKFAYLWRFI